MARREGESGFFIGIVKKVKTLKRKNGGQRNLTAENAKSAERESGSRTRTRTRRMEKLLGS